MPPPDEASSAEAQRRSPWILIPRTLPMTRVLSTYRGGYLPKPYRQFLLHKPCSLLYRYVGPFGTLGGWRNRAVWCRRLRVALKQLDGLYRPSVQEVEPQMHVCMYVCIMCVLEKSGFALHLYSSISLLLCHHTYAKGPCSGTILFARFAHAGMLFYWNAGSRV